MIKSNSITNERIAEVEEGRITLGGITREGQRLFSERYVTGASAPVIFYLADPHGDVHDWEISRCIFTVEGDTTHIFRKSVISSSNSGSKIQITTSHMAREAPNSKPCTTVIYIPKEDEVYIYKGKEKVSYPFLPDNDRSGGRSTARRARYGQGSIGSQRSYNDLKGSGYNKGFSTARTEFLKDNM